MRTTIEIADPLLDEARRVADTEGTTMRSLVEEGLRAVLARRKPAVSFRLRKASFKGKGLTAEALAGGWGFARAAAYEGRGA